MTESYTRSLTVGMGQAVAERTILRRKADGSFETWGDVARRVAAGNASLIGTATKALPDDHAEAEQAAMERHIGKATLLMSGRHLQHGDDTQASRPLEVFSNCSTAAASFLLFMLLLNGAGVGRCYDDDMMLTNWDHAPNLRCVLDTAHADFDWASDESLRDARHKYAGENVTWHEVADTREGWAKAIEIWETMTFQKIHRDATLVLDFSKVRPKGSPIMGMQGRPSSGPKPLMGALQKCASIKGSGMRPWRQALYVDHYLAECVLVGGARRAARMSMKSWRDPGILDFISVKRPIEFAGMSMEEVIRHRDDMAARGEASQFPYLWSSNNSVAVDAEFWEIVGTAQSAAQRGLRIPALHRRAWDIVNAIAAASYGDGTGEPGLINVDKLNQNPDGLVDIVDGSFVGSTRYVVEDDTRFVLSRLARAARSKRYHMTTNPCVTADTMVMTSEGPRQVGELVGHPFEAVVDGVTHTASGFWSTGVKPVFKVETKRGYSVRATGDHKVLVETDRRVRLDRSFAITQQWKAVSNLAVGDRLVLSDNTGVSPDTDDTEFRRGWVVGQIKGDGGHNLTNGCTYARFWGWDAHLSEIAADVVRGLGADNRFVGPVALPAHSAFQVRSVTLGKLATPYMTSIAKTLLPALEKAPSAFVAGFIRGMFDSDGCVQGSVAKGRSVRLNQSDLPALEMVQRMLSRFGIASTIYLRRDVGVTALPDGRGGEADFFTKANYELVVSKDNIGRFQSKIGFFQPEKAARLVELVADTTRAPYKERFTAEVKSVTPDGTEEVFDCTVEGVHRFDANGIVVHNCGEISLSVLGGYCVIADVVPFHADTLDEAEDAFRVATRALIRVNQMDNLYAGETQRTNRIGVGITGIHEFAWKFFQVGFRDMVRPDFETFFDVSAYRNGGPLICHASPAVRAAAFWMTLSRFSRAVQEEAISYSDALGVSRPHSVTTIKPAGTTSKLFGLTEGWHLPAMAHYMRWVQFRSDSPLVEAHRANGYPTRELRSYAGTTIVGFPTLPAIGQLGMGDALVTAGEASPEDQYRWLELGEKYWIVGTDADGESLHAVGEDRGNQISYTLKYDPAVVGYAEFRDMLIRHQSQIRCCSVMPQTDTSTYEYLPEEALTKAQYEGAMREVEALQRGGEATSEDIGFEHVGCAGGACPVFFVEGDKTS